MASLPPYLLYIIAFAGALVISLTVAPQIISIAGRKQLFDVADNKRKLHTGIIPPFGGVAIFFAFIIIASLLVQEDMYGKWHYLVAGSLLFFLTGLMDDLIALSAGKKLIAQLIPICIVIVLGDIRLMSLHSLFGIAPLPYWMSIIITIGGCAFFTNAFNFIDGIDGLAGMAGILYTFIIGLCLALTGSISAACIAFSLMGATAGFLRYNITPARLFMGDTGSLLLGFTIFILSVLFINDYNGDYGIAEWINSPQSAIIMCVAVLSMPVADGMRVFILRMSKGISPFHADRKHLHYYLLDLGMTDLRAAAIIICINIIMIITAFLLQDLGTGIMISGLILLATANFIIVHILRKKRLDKVQAEGN